MKIKYLPALCIFLPFSICTMKLYTPGNVGTHTASYYHYQNPQQQLLKNFRSLSLPKIDFFNPIKFCTSPSDLPTQDYTNTYYSILKHALPLFQETILKIEERNDTICGHIKTLLRINTSYPLLDALKKAIDEMKKLYSTMNEHSTDNVINTRHITHIQYITYLKHINTLRALETIQSSDLTKNIPELNSHIFPIITDLSLNSDVVAPPKVICIINFFIYKLFILFSLASLFPSSSYWIVSIKR